MGIYVHCNYAKYIILIPRTRVDKLKGCKEWHLFLMTRLATIVKPLSYGEQWRADRIGGTKSYAR